MSKNIPREASRFWARQLTEACADVEPMLEPRLVARNAASSSKSRALRAPAPPERIWLPVKDARPALSGGSWYEPARSVTETVTSGSWWSSTRYATAPASSSWRWAAGSGGS